MKRLISFFCVFFIVLQVGCASQKEISHDNSVVTNLVVEPGDVGPSFLLKNGNLYGWNTSGIYDDSYLVDEDNLLMMQDVESFLYQDGLWDDMHASEEGARILYVKKNDGSFWMRGHCDFLESEDKKVIHNYKQLTKVMDDVKLYYKDFWQGVYVIKNDNTLWFCQRSGQKFNERKEYDFFKVLDNVESLSVGYIFSYALKKDGSLWAINTDDFSSNKVEFDNSSNDLVGNISWCNVDGYTVCVADKNGDMWCWEDKWNENKEIVTPKKISSNVTKYVSYGDTENDWKSVYFRNDNSIFVMDHRKLEAVEVAANVSKVVPKNDYYTGGPIRFYILDRDGLLYKYNKKTQKKTDISSNVKDFVYCLQLGNAKEIIFVKDDYTLVTCKGEILLDNVTGLYMGESINFTKSVAIADNKVYELKKKGPKYIFTLEQ